MAEIQSYRKALETIKEIISTAPGLYTGSSQEEWWMILREIEEIAENALQRHRQGDIKQNSLFGDIYPETGD